MLSAATSNLPLPPLRNNNMCAPSPGWRAACAPTLAVPACHACCAPEPDATDQVEEVKEGGDAGQQGGEASSWPEKRVILTLTPKQYATQAWAPAVPPAATQMLAACLLGAQGSSHGSMPALPSMTVHHH
jgi:hypothetical protein